MPCMENFTPSLLRRGVSEQVIEKINEGYPDLNSTLKKKDKAAYFARAMAILDREADRDAVIDALDDTACCRSGARLKASKAFFKENASLPLAEKLEKVTGVPNMGAAKLNERGQIEIQAVRFFDGERFACACPNFNKSGFSGDVSRSYCFCCAGHFRFHYEIMLGVKLRLREVLSSPLDTGGKESCAFLFDIL